MLADPEWQFLAFMAAVTAHVWIEQVSVVRRQLPAAAHETGSR